MLTTLSVFQRIMCVLEKQFRDFKYNELAPLNRKVARAYRKLRVHIRRESEWQRKSEETDSLGETESDEEID